MLRTKWQHTLKLKDLLTNDDSDETAVNVARETKIRVQNFAKSRGFEQDDALEEITYWFDDVATCNDFNGVLNELYDWADDNRVWID